MHIKADYIKESKELQIKLYKFNETHLSALKQIDGAMYMPAWKGWSIPLHSAPALKSAFPTIEWVDETTYLEACVDYSATYSERVDEDVNIPADYVFKRQPFEHQKQIIRKVLNNDKYAILAEMGTGKTQSMLNALDILDGMGECVYPVLVVAPKSVLENWSDEISINTRGNSVVCTGPRKRRIKTLESPATHYIINYEGVRVILDELRAKRFKTIILDESTYIKNHRADRTKAINTLAQEIKRRYILTGTPITNAPLDAFSQFKFLSPHFLGFSSYYAFRGHFCVMGGFKNKQVLTYQNLDELKLSIAKHSIRILKKDCLDLPDKLYQVRRLDMTQELKSQKKEMVQDLKLTLLNQEKILAPIVLTQLLRLSQINGGHFLQGPNPKVDEVKKILSETSGKMVIWCNFRESLQLIGEMFQKEGVHFVWLTGDTQDRQEIISKFNNNPEVRVFIGMVQAAGMGINLTSASTVIYFENTFSLQNRLQSEDRCHRIGQKNNVTYIDLIYPKTIDEKILSALKGKKEVAKYLVDSLTEILE